MEMITLSFSISVHAIEIQIKQHGNATLLHYNGSTITRVPLAVLSTKLSMAKKTCSNFILWELIFADHEKTAKIRSCKNLVPHGS